MRISKVFCLFLIVVLLVGLLPLTVGAQSRAEIEPALLDKLTADGTANFFVKMALEADTSAATGMGKQARRAHVWNKLNEVANATQGPVIDYCRKNGLDCIPMLINNSVFVRGGSLDAARGLAALPGVAYLRLERIYQLLDPIVGGVGLDGFVTADAKPDAITDWGITDTKADQVWDTFGVRGAGIKVASIDTGVQWNHPALVNQFACPGDPSNADCWADPSNICGGTACDNNGHGTHTMGIMVAKDDQAFLYISGMAPDATWIACKGCETNSCSESALTACAGWILAPGGDPANAPDIVNNSWGGSGQGDDWYQSSVTNWRNAGIFPAFAAGNSGPNCNTLVSPGDYQGSFSSAYHDSGRNIGSLSSHGPSLFGHTPFTKPNISAPGVNICSTVPTNSWSCAYSGASLASPHTAGAVALAWSGCPELRGQIDTTFQLIQIFANTPPSGTCGAPPDGEGNYTYGYGYLDALAMVTACTEGLWTEIALPASCPDWTRHDAEYYPGTGKAYILGGRSGTSTLGDIYAFDPVAQSCTDTRADMPVPISNYTIVTVNNGTADLLCTFGGRQSDGNFTTAVQCYNPVANSVSQPSTLPGELGQYITHGAAAVNNIAYVFGGFRNTAEPYHTAETWAWNPVLNSWTPQGGLSLARGYIDVAVVNGKIYGFGGDIYQDGSLVAQTVTEVFNPATGNWDDAAVADLPYASGEGRAYGFDTASAYELAGKIVIAGGGKWSGEWNEVEIYDVASDTYDYSFRNLNVQRRDYASFFVPGYAGVMWVLGGRSSAAGYGGDNPPYAPPEYYEVPHAWHILLPAVLRN